MSSTSISSSLILTKPGMILEASSVIDAFAQRVQASGERTAIWHKVQGDWHSVSWNELDALSSRLAQDLASLGISAATMVAHQSENRLAWLVTDLALQKLQAVHLPLHASFTPTQASALVEHAQPDVSLLSPTLVEAWKAIGSSRPMLVIDEEAKVVLPSSVPSRMDSIDHIDLPQKTSLLLYTSGTSGKPRGVCLSSRGLAANAVATQLAFAIGQPSDAADQRVRLNVLPLSHVYALVCDFYGTIIDGAQLALSPSRQTWLQDAAEIRPTFLNAVPYYYERLAAEVRQVASDISDVPTQIKTLQELTGGRLVHCCVGGAAASGELQSFFVQRGIPLLAGYGLTENSPCISVSGPHVYRAGSVGKIVPGLEARLSSEQEILVRGPSVMLGYYRDPWATAAALQEGWLHTGDLGTLDADGFLFLQGRKTEMLVTSLGKNIWPGNLERLILRDPLFQQVVVVGDARPHLAALVVLAAESSSSEVEIQVRIAAQLVDLPSHEQVRRVLVLERPLQAEYGELTSKNEPCRQVIAENYRSQIAALYDRTSPF